MTEKKENRGGAREGAGRKPEGKKPKKPLGTKVSVETVERVAALAKESGQSQAFVIEHAIKNIKGLPKKV